MYLFRPVELLLSPAKTSKRFCTGMLIPSQIGQDPAIRFDICSLLLDKVDVNTQS